MKNYKYKTLVLSVLKKTASSILKSSVSLAKMIDIEIALFQVKEHTDILDRAKNKTKNKIKADTSLNEVLSKLNVSLLVSEA